MSEEASTNPQPPESRPVESRPASMEGIEGKSAAEWIGVGLGASSFALQAYNTFKPSDSAAPPPPADNATPTPPPAETPPIELLPGVDRE